MGRVVGIDLGTTNSVIATNDGGERLVIPNVEGSRLTPSVVAFTRKGERLVGQLAKRQAVVNPERTIMSIKRLMGTDQRVTIDGHPYTPQEISAIILQKLKRDAEVFLGDERTDYREALNNRTKFAEALVKSIAYNEDADKKSFAEMKDFLAEVLK